MRISVFGLGYVGAVSMACLARDGHDLIGVDIDPAKLELIRGGRSPIVEEGIQELMREVVDKKRVQVTGDAAEALANSSLSFVCVGTPSSANGSQDMRAILQFAEDAGNALRKKESFHAFVIRSTVQPGTVEERIIPRIAEVSGKRHGEGFAVGFQPEFLREGSSIRDYDNPPFTIVGSADRRVEQALRELFEHLPGEFVSTSIRTAETMKYACNAFHAAKITFANEIGRLSQAMGVDGRQVMDLVCRDTRLNISPAYLKPGFAFGGSCLPKDLKALLHFGKLADVTTPMLAGILPSNRVHVDHAIDQILAHGRPKIGMLGLSFKTGTDDLRESPLVTIAERFIGKGCPLKIHDPEVSLSRLLGANKRYIEETIPHIGSLLCQTVDDVVRESDIVIVGISRPDLLERLISTATPEQIVYDLVDIPGPERFKARYQGVCW